MPLHLAFFPYDVCFTRVSRIFAACFQVPQSGAHIHLCTNFLIHLLMGKAICCGEAAADLGSF